MVPIVKLNVNRHFFLRSSSTAAPIPFKNDGSFLEQFKQLQQSSLKSATCTQVGAATSSSVFTPAQSSNLQSLYIPPGPTPINITVPPPSSYFQQQCNPQYSNPPPQYSQPPPSIKMPMKGEVKREDRSPSPYSPSRPCEDEEEQVFINNKGEWSTCIAIKEQQCWAGFSKPEQYSSVS